MDLSKVKVGDEVLSCLKGWCTVISTKSSSKFSVETELDVYMLDGRASEEDINPEIMLHRPQKKKWKPDAKENGVTIRLNGEIDKNKPNANLIEEGRVYNTEAQAKHAYKSIRICQIFNAYVAVYAPDYVADWDDTDQVKCSIFYNHDGKAWDFTTTCLYQHPEIVYMPEETAKQLRKDLNDEVVKL